MCTQSALMCSQPATVCTQPEIVCNQLLSWTREGNSKGGAHWLGWSRDRDVRWLDWRCIYKVLKVCMGMARRTEGASREGVRAPGVC